MVYRIGVTGFGGSTPWVHGPTQAFLRSAYLEEILPDYRRRTPETFLTLEPKSIQEFWTRNLYSMGYAVEYAAKDNPFSPELISTEVWAYLWDAVTYVIIGGAVINRSGETALAGLSVGAIGHVLWIGSKQAHLDYYNRIVASGYGIPRFARYDTLQNRSRALEAPPTSPASKVMGSNPFREEQVAQKTPAGEKALIIMLSPMVGGLGGWAYYSLKNGYRSGDAGAFGSLLAGMVVGMLCGIQIAIEL